MTENVRLLEVGLSSIVVEKSHETVTLIEQASPRLIESEGGTLVITEESFELISEGIQGPPGSNPGGSGGSTEEEMAYAERTDIVDDALIYKGQATPGVTDATPLWRIKRLTIGLDGDVTTQWADGNANFDNVWVDRASLSYV